MFSNRLKKMIIDRDLWLGPFKLSEFPKWKCPSCFFGLLELSKKSISIKPNSKLFKDTSRKNYKQFTAIFECSNEKCQENVVLVGDYLKKLKEGRHIGVDPSDYNRLYFPLYFYPSPHIFEIPEYICPEVELRLIEVFELYWTNTSACANAMRKVVDEILNDKKIRKKSSKKDKNGKYPRLTLHQRLDLFKKEKPKYKDVTEMLIAVKWIGNSGSHETSVDEDKLLDGLEILEYVIYDIYDESQLKRIKRLTTSINNKKG